MVDCRVAPVPVFVLMEYTELFEDKYGEVAHGQVGSGWQVQHCVDVAVGDAG